MKKRSRLKVLSMLLVMVMIFVCAGITGCCSQKGKALNQYWSENSEAAESLRSYVAMVTNEKDFALI